MLRTAQSGTLSRSVKILDATPEGSILSVRVEGVHGDGHADSMSAFIKAAVGQYGPAAVLLDLSGYSYRWGDDLGCLVLASIHRTPDRPRPCAIVATGRTRKSLLRLFEASRVTDMLPVRIFGQRNLALDYLRRSFVTIAFRPERPGHIPSRWVVSRVRSDGRLDEAERLDAGCCPHTSLRETVRARQEQGHRNFILDLKSVAKMDSSGIGEVFAAHRQAQALGGTMALLFSAEVESLLGLVGLGDVEGLCHSMQEALEFAEGGGQAR